MVAAAVVATIAVAAPAAARFTASPATSASFAAARLAPATALALTWQCPPGNNRTAVLAWTASTSAFADGYLVERLDPATGAVIASTPTTQTTFSQSVAKRTAVRYRVVATASNWRSSGIEVTGTAPAGNC
jgi:hypothetical protein